MQIWKAAHGVSGQSGMHALSVPPGQPVGVGVGGGGGGGGPGGGHEEGGQSGFVQKLQSLLSHPASAQHEPVAPW